MANWNEGRDKFIASLYSAALSPEHYDEVFDALDEFIFSDLKNTIADNPRSQHISNGSRRLATDPDLLIHFKRAYDVQAQVGRQKSKRQKIQTLLDATPNPAFVFDISENIIAINDLMENISQNQCHKLTDCCDNKYILANIRKFIEENDGQDLLIEPRYTNAGKNINSCVLVRKVAKYSDLDTPEQQHTLGEKLYYFTIVDLRIDSSKTDLFKTTYDLTGAEVDIATQLASGKQLPEIANQRGVTVATIRTQFKSVKRKTGSRDISSVVRLLCGFSAGILAAAHLTDVLTQNINNKTQLIFKSQITLKDGRTLSYLEQGSPDGIPVIMLHTMPYGQELLKDTAKAAKRMGLRIISPFRPGYGATHMPENIRDDKILDVTAKDICELLDYLDIAKADIIGTGVGPIYAMRFASLFPNRVANLFAISRPPIWRDKWLENMAIRQRLILRLAKYLPQLLPLILRATMAYVDKGHAQDLFKTVCAESAADMVALNNPETCALLEREFIEGLQQGTHAVRFDCFIAIADYSQEASRLKHRFHILHGDDDKVFDITQSQAFVDMVPGTKLEIIEGAGHLLIYSHWQHVLRAIKKKHQ